MIVLRCPHCGPRNVSEFASLGEVVDRPDPRDATPEEWRAYLYLRANPAGPVHERWFHRSGCRQYFDARRDTTNNHVYETWALRRGAQGTGANPHG